MKNVNHYKVCGELIECMKLSHSNGEIAELEYKGISIKYDGVGIDANGQGDSVIMLYREGVNDENTGNEVARILLSGNKEYIVYDSSKTGFYPELIEK